MKLVATIKLRPSREQANALWDTLRRCNQACTWLAEKGFDSKVFGQYALHKLAYRDMRERFGLAAQAAVRCIAKVAHAFKVNREVAPRFRPDAAQPYDGRIFRFVQNGEAVSIWTVAERIIVPCVTGEYQHCLLAFRKGEADLALIRGKWFLVCTCDVPETESFDPEDWLGVDLGIINIATDSDGWAHTGAVIEAVRAWYADRRAILQKVGSKAAKRRLRRLSGRQRRFQRHQNHVIAKALVSTAQRTGRGIALEELRHIRRRVTARRDQRARLHNWSFGQLRAFVAYKAKLAGVPVLYVDPRHTSLGCSCCGVIDKRNRPDQATFSCIECGHTAPADFNAAVNIRSRAARASVTTPDVLAAA